MEYRQHSTKTCGINSICDFPDYVYAKEVQALIADIYSACLNGICANRQGHTHGETKKVILDMYFNTPSSRIIALDAYLIEEQEMSMKVLLALGFEHHVSWININTGNRIYGFLLTQKLPTKDNLPSVEDVLKLEVKGGD